MLIFLPIMLLLTFLLVGAILQPNRILSFLPENQRNNKYAFLIFGMPLCILFLSFISNIKDGPNYVKEEKLPVIEKEVQLPVIEKEVQLNKESKEEENIKFLDVNYVTMWENYDKEIYDNKHIRYAGPISSIGDKTVSIRDGLDGLTSVVYLTVNENNKNKLAQLEEGDYVILTGLINTKFVGQISIEDGDIAAVGEAAETLTNKYKTETEELKKARAEAQLETEKKNMLEFKDNAVTVDYDDLVRNPHNYKNKAIIVDLKVTQILTGGILTEDGYNGKADKKDEWYMHYKLPENSSRIIEGDNIRFYGNFYDIVEMKRLLLKVPVLIPKMDVMYFEFLD